MKNLTIPLCTLQLIIIKCTSFNYDKNDLPVVFDQLYFRFWMNSYFFTIIRFVSDHELLISHIIWVRVPEVNSKGIYQLSSSDITILSLDKAKPCHHNYSVCMKLGIQFRIIFSVTHFYNELILRRNTVSTVSAFTWYFTRLYQGNKLSHNVLTESTKNAA